MSTTTSPKKTIVSPAAEPRPAPAEQAPSVWREFFDGLASLKLTVWLFALSIILVFAGTLAQVDKEIWQVMDEYFRTFITRIDFQLFFPRSFFPSGPQVSGGVYFPGGWLLGVLLAVNLVAAHGVRFRPQARGRRLVAGILLVAAGVGLTWLVIAGASASEGLPAAPWLGWGTLWKLLLLGLAGVWGVLVVALIKFDSVRRHERRILAIAAVLLAGLLGWLITQPEAGRLDNSSMRILWQLTKGSAGGLVLLAGCALVFRKRAGVVLLHGGIALLMFNELLVGLTAVEGTMNISEGQTINYVEDARRLELAVVDKSNREYDDVVVVPQAMLSRETTIRHPDLPFDVRVEAFYKNAELQPVAQDAPNPATAGMGLNWRANEVRAVSTTEAREKGDNFAAYVTLLNKQNAESMGTYLVSRIQTAAELPEIVKVDARPYKLYLRHKRIYKPYQIRLIDVKKEDYLGANTPRHFSSQVQLVDKSRAVDQTMNIWMNNPLRYAGETFYQSNYFRDPETGVESTTLQVVTNAGWMIPYVACMIVGTGMLAHFLFVLLRFLDRRARERSSAAPLTANDSLPPLPLLQKGRRWTAWALPACVVLACGAWIGWESLPPRQPDGQFKLYDFGKLPVVFQGRVQPIDTLARNALLVMSQRQDFVDAAGQRQPAVRWLLDVIARPESAAAHKVVRIEHPELLATLGLEARAGFRYAPAEFQSQRDNLHRQARVAQAHDVALLSVYQKKVVELENKLALYDLLVDSFQTPVVRNDPLTKDLDLRVAAQRADLLAQRTPPLAIPVAEGEQTWISYPAAWLENARRPEGSIESETSFVASLGATRAAYVADDVERFNTEVDAYLASVGQLPSSTLDVGKVRLRSVFQSLCAVLSRSRALCICICARGSILADVDASAQPGSLLADCAHVCRAQPGPGGADRDFRPATGDKPVFVGHFHRLGCGLVGAGDRTGLPDGHRQRGGIGRRLCDSVDRALSGGQRRYVGRFAGRARHAVLAGNARGVHHAGLHHHADGGRFWACCTSCGA